MFTHKSLLFETFFVEKWFHLGYHIGMEGMNRIKIDGKDYILTPADNTPVGTEYIRSVLGITSSTLSRSPWHYPDYGKAVKGHKRTKPYRKSDVDSWLAIPARTRRRRYMEEMNEAGERDGIAGAAGSRIGQPTQAANQNGTGNGAAEVRDEDHSRRDCTHKLFRFENSCSTMNLWIIRTFRRKWYPVSQKAGRT